jgi:hypothetical protein
MLELRSVQGAVGMKMTFSPGFRDSGLAEEEMKNLRTPSKLGLNH